MLCTTNPQVALGQPFGISLGVSHGDHNRQPKIVFARMGLAEPQIGDTIHVH